MAPPDVQSQMLDESLPASWARHASPSVFKFQIFEASLLWKEQRYSDALKLYQEAQSTLGYVACLVYNVALCYYSMKQYGPALKQYDGKTWPFSSSPHFLNFDGRL